MPDTLAPIRIDGESEIQELGRCDLRLHCLLVGNLRQWCGRSLDVGDLESRACYGVHSNLLPHCWAIVSLQEYPTDASTIIIFDGPDGTNALAHESRSNRVRIPSMASA